MSIQNTENSAMSIQNTDDCVLEKEVPKKKKSKL